MDKNTNKSFPPTSGNFHQSSSSMSSPGDESSIGEWLTIPPRTARKTPTAKPNKPLNSRSMATRSSSKQTTQSSHQKATTEFTHFRKLQETLLPLLHSWTHTEAAKAHESYLNWVDFWTKNVKKEDTWNKIKRQFNLHDFHDYYQMLLSCPTIPQNLDILWDKTNKCITYRTKQKSTISTLPCIMALSKNTPTKKYLIHHLTLIQKPILTLF